MMFNVLKDVDSGQLNDLSGASKVIEQMVNGALFSPDGRGAAPGWLIGKTGAYRSTGSLCAVLKAMKFIGYNDNVDKFQGCAACTSSGIPRQIQAPNARQFASMSTSNGDPVTWLESLVPLAP